jgi:sigma-E factor negative regulatory protein RseB
MLGARGVIRVLVAVAAGFGVWLGGIPAYACVLPPPGAGEGSAAGLLIRAMRAATDTPYSGVQWMTASDAGSTTTVLLDVSHVPGEGSTVAPVQTSLTGGQGAFDPASASGALASTARGGRPSGAAEIALLEAHYALSVAGDDEVAGRPARVVEAHRLAVDQGSVVGRWWVDRETDLVLRTEVFTPAGRLVRSSGYVTVTIGGQVHRGPGGGPALRSPAHPGAGPAAGVSRPEPVPSPWKPAPPRVVQRMRSHGFVLPEHLGRGFVRYDVRAKRTQHGPVVHLSYSDGLSTVSVFEQSGRLEPDRLSGFARTRIAGTDVWQHGRIPRRVVWSAGGTVYTLVTDAPTAAVGTAVRTLPHHGAGDGALDRIQHGFVRIGSWLNPFS